MATTVSGVLRQFLPGFLSNNPCLTPAQRRAIWAILHCRTAALGGRLFACQPCGTHHYAYHSCNHKACPQCGRQATAQWVKRELAKLTGAPYFMVTFTLPAELRELFFGPDAKKAYDLFFAAASGALAEKLARGKGLQAPTNGFTALLHTWNQQLLFHPHLHVLVPGAGIRGNGKVVTVKNANFLLHISPLRGAFRQHFRRLLVEHDWEVDPKVWRKQWGVDIRPFGQGQQALKYLGAYVCRTAIGDSRIVACNEHTVSFRYKDRADGGRIKVLTLPGQEFVARYLRHVLPRGLRSIRYYGFCHPAASKNRERVRFHTDQPLVLESTAQKSLPDPAQPWPCCPCCQRPMKWVGRLPPVRLPGPTERAPP
jgi:hypothetical protein